MRGLFLLFKIIIFCSLVFAEEIWALISVGNLWLLAA